MFHSILRPRELPRREYVGGAGLALPVCAGLAALALWLPGRQLVPPDERDRFIAAPLRPAPPSVTLAPAPPRPAPPGPAAAPRSRELVAPAAIPTTPPVAAEPSGPLPPGDVDLPPAAAPSLASGPGGGGRAGADEGGGGGPIPLFDARTMKDPVFLSGPSPRYTERALERGVQGTATARCVVGLDGRVRDCRIVRSLPFLDREVIEALERRRYVPATLAGHPVEVDYEFRVKMRMEE